MPAWKGMYIVSDEGKFVYFVVQKVACSSIKTALMPLFGFDPTGPAVHIRRGVPRLSVHGLFRKSEHQIDKEQLTAKLDRDEYRDYFKFAFVRNPWDRLVSCYFDKVVNKEGGIKLGPGSARIEQGTPFAEFVEAVCTTPDAEANSHFRSQHVTVCGPGKDKPIMADFVGRFENLAADFGVVADRIGAEGLKLPRVVPHELRSGGAAGPRPPYTAFYDDGLRKLVHERYRADIEIFDYSFGPSAPS